MTPGLLIIFALTIGATLFVVITSVALVIDKFANATARKARENLYGKYAEVMTTALLQDLPPLPETSKTSAIFSQYEELLRPVRETLVGRLPPDLAFRRDVLKLVMIDYAKDLVGESSERLVYYSYSLGFVDEEIKLLQNKRWWIRAQAARDLGLLRARRAVTGLTAALEDEHPDVRHQAMGSLIILVGVEALRTIFRISRNLSIWTTIELSTIVMQYKEEAVPYLVEALESQDQSVVLFCIEMLAEIGFVSAVEPLRSMARDYPNVVIRAKAVEALGRLGDQRSEGLLLSLIQNPIPNLRLKAIEALRSIGSPESVKPLMERVRRGNTEEQILAIRAIASTGDEGIESLKSLISEDRVQYHRLVDHVLEELNLEPVES